MFADPNDMSNPWNWPRYNPPGMLIGPLPHKKMVRSKRTPRGVWYKEVTYYADFSSPGVTERINVEVDFNEDMAYDKRKL